MSTTTSPAERFRVACWLSYLEVADLVIEGWNWTPDITRPGQGQELLRAPAGDVYLRVSYRRGHGWYAEPCNFPHLEAPED